jgi:hypothetical protein
MSGDGRCECVSKDSMQSAEARRVPMPSVTLVPVTFRIGFRTGYPIQGPISRSPWLCLQMTETGADNATCCSPSTARHRSITRACCCQTCSWRGPETPRELMWPSLRAHKMLVWLCEQAPRATSRKHGVRGREPSCRPIFLLLVHAHARHGAAVQICMRRGRAGSRRLTAFFAVPAMGAARSRES